MARLPRPFPLALVGLVLLRLVAPAPHSGGPHDSPPTSLDAVLDSLRGSDGFPGATAALVGPTTPLQAAATGWADREARAPMTPDARMLSGSTGKSFVAAVAVSLAQGGQLDLDAPIARWLGDRPWFHRLPNAEALTLRLLLRHQSGLRDHIRSDAFRRAAQRRMQTQGPDAAFRPEELVQYVLEPIRSSRRAMAITTPTRTTSWPASSSSRRRAATTTTSSDAASSIRWASRGRPRPPGAIFRAWCPATTRARRRSGCRRR